MAWMLHDRVTGPRLSRARAYPWHAGGSEPVHATTATWVASHQPEHEADATVDDGLQQPVGAPLLGQQRLELARGSAGAAPLLQRVGAAGAAVRAAAGRSAAPRCFSRSTRPRQPTCSFIQRSRKGLAVFHRSRSGSSWRPRPSMLSRVFCSSTSCGWISTLKRREVWNRRSSTWPSEMSFSGRSKFGSQHGADRALELVDAGVRRHPAAFDVQLGHALVVAPEEGEEVLRQVVLVELGQRADDAEVERDVAAEGCRLDADLDVARVHVGVEEAVAEHLREEDRHAVARQLLDVDAGLAQALDLADRHAVHALHHDHVVLAQVPDHLGHQHQIADRPCCGAAGRRWPPRAPGRVRRAGSCRTRPPPRAASGAWRRPRQRSTQRGQRVHQRQVSSIDRQHARAQHLDRDFAAVVQRGEVHLRDRGAGHRPRVEAGEQRADRARRRRARPSRSPARRETAAPGPAARPARRRCRAAAGRAGSTAPART